MDQISRRLIAREVERTFPLATGTEIIKLPLGARVIVAQEALLLETEFQTRRMWYSRFSTTIVAELSVPLAALETSFGLDRDHVVTSAELPLNETVVIGDFRRSVCQLDVGFSPVSWSNQVCSGSI